MKNRRSKTCPLKGQQPAESCGSVIAFRRLTLICRVVPLVLFALLLFTIDLSAQEAQQTPVHVHVIGDWWNIPEVGGGSGATTFQLNTGNTYLIEGLKGWSAVFRINEEGRIEIGHIAEGPMMAEPPSVETHPAPLNDMPGESIRITLPPLKRISLDIHAAYGSYTVAGVMMEWTGRRVVHLPEGRFRVQGTNGWWIELQVNDDGIEILDILPGKLGRTFSRIAVTDFTVVSGPPDASRVVFGIPAAAGEYTIEHVLPAGIGDRAAWLPPGEYVIKANTPEEEGWRIHFSVTNAGVESASLTGEPPQNASFSHDSRTISLVIPERTRQIAPEPALYTFVQLGRRTFRRGETIHLTSVLNSNEPAEGRFAIIVRTVAPAEPASIELFSQQWTSPGGRHSRNFHIDSSALAPGEYDLIAQFADHVSNASHVIIVRGEQERPTRFAICSYSHPDVIFAEKNLFNAVIHDNFGPQMLSPRIDERSRQRYMAGWSGPVVQPYGLNQNIPRGQKILEDLTHYNLDAMLQYPAQSQFFHAGTCFVDPHIRDAAARGAALNTTAARKFDAFRGFVIGREMAWPRHPDPYLDDSCPFCEQDFARHSGLQVPRSTNDADAWRQWMLYKQHGIADFFEHVGRRVLSIKPNIHIASQQGNQIFRVTDGVYPPITDIPLTISTAHWLAKSHGSLTSVLGHEFVRMSPEHVPYWPTVVTTNSQWPWITGEEARHAIYMAVSRQTEGVGHLTGAAAPDTPRFAGIIGGEVHPNLTLYGDLLLQLKRDAGNEIAVFFSFEEQHRNCTIQERITDDGARRHVDTVALALFSLLRSQFQAGLINEEDILAGKLESRPALLLAGITVMRPEVRQRIEEYAAGPGYVFIDRQTSIEIAGAQVIDCSFDAMWRRQVDGRDVDDAWPSDDRLYVRSLLPIVDETFGDIIPRRAKSDTPLAITTLLKAGSGQFVWVVNDNVAMGNMAPDSEGYKSMPLQVRLHLPDSPAIYDVFSDRRIEGNIAELDLAPGDARLFACLPENPARIEAAATIQRNGNRMQIAWRADVLNGNNERIAAPLPVQITILDPQGKMAANLYRATSPDAPATGNYSLPLNYAAGTWSVRATSLLGGASTNTRVEAPAPSGVFVRELADLLPVVDSEAINDTLQKASSLVIIIGNTGYAQIAESVAAKLREAGKQVDIRLASEMRQRQLDSMFGHGMHRRWHENIGGPLTGVIRPAIIVGKPVDNPFIADVMLDSDIAGHLVTPDYPGAGRGLLIHIYSAFSFTQNSIIITGSDSAGIAKAAERLTAGL